MSCKHRGYFILTTFTLPHLRTYWYTGISASHSFRAVHSEFCQTALLVILTIWQPHPHCHTQLVPLQTFPHLAVLGCASHDFPELITLIVCIRLTLFGVLVNSLQGVTPSFEISVMQFSKTTFIKLFVTLGYAFVGYSHRFRRRTCHTICNLIQSYQQFYSNDDSGSLSVHCSWNRFGNGISGAEGQPGETGAICNPVFHV